MGTSKPGVTAPSEKPSPRVPSPFRPDIEGLRAIAVLLVLIWHAGITQIPGGFIGVDVFFVVSGFLMTGILHRELVQRQRISILRFYARRARRLIPASLVVLVVTAIGTWAVLPATRWWDTGLEIGAAGTYVVNWLLAATSVDYLAQDAAASPVQHFWSLSVEEQYYLVWPVILVVAAWFVRRLNASITASVLSILAVAFAGSLAWSIYQTPQLPGPSYFVTTTRIWELALGGIVALTAHRFARIPAVAAALLGWLGVAAILGTAALLTANVPFPGAIALVPTIATAAILAVGNLGGRAGCAAVMDNLPTQWIGRLSYSLYLWHWPTLVIGGYLVTGGIDKLSVTSGVALVVLSVIPAALSYRYVEVPFRDSKELTKSTRKSLLLGVVGVLLALVAGVALAAGGKLAERSAPEARYTSVDSPVTFGAAVTDEPGDGSISPSPLVAQSDNPPVYAQGCHQPFSSDKPVACEFGNPSSEVTIALVGDSHAAHWVNALSYVAEERGWRLLTYTKSSCALIDAPVLNRGGPTPKCQQWNENVLAEIDSLKPSAVFVSNVDYQLAGARDNDRELAEALARSWSAIDATGAPVYVLRDTPASKFDPPDCIAGHLSTPELCATPRDEAFGGRGMAQLEAATYAPVALVDITSSVCPSDPCSPVIGGVMVYRDKTHMTATFSRSLGPVLNRAVPGIDTR